MQKALELLPPPKFRSQTQNYGYFFMKCCVFVKVKVSKYKERIPYLCKLRVFTET
jgi:hypothetical protein